MVLSCSSTFPPFCLPDSGQTAWAQEYLRKRRGGFGEFAEFLWFEIALEECNFGCPENVIYWTGKGRSKLRKLPNSPNHIKPTSHVRGKEV